MVNNRTATRAGRFSGSFRQWLYRIVFGTLKNNISKISKHLLCCVIVCISTILQMAVVHQQYVAHEGFSPLTKLIRCLFCHKTRKMAFAHKLSLTFHIWGRWPTSLQSLSFLCVFWFRPTLFALQNTATREKRTAKITTTSTKRNKWERWNEGRQGGSARRSEMK